ncbi:hypothetical protein FACS1894189_4830 [Planctomycetales bacterium]|nr:hypothetical protein FACS1894189_4830 [Planctomycetales bacterium]
MRLVFVPLIISALLIVLPTAVYGISNQEAAEKIAQGLGERFPNATIDVSYQAGKVWLHGEVASQEISRQASEYVFKVSGVSVSEVNNEIQVVPRKGTPAQSAVPISAPAPSVRQPRSSEPVPVPIPNQRPAVRTASASMAITHNAAAEPVYGPPQPQAAYGPPPQAAYHPEAYGPQGPLPGQYNQPNLPDYAWPSYANYPNYGAVSYPKQYSPKAWPYIGPFYPYPQTPLGWRKVTLENHDGWWWLDFDDGTPSGPFSPLFRQPVRYTY